jgi:phage shock protein A
MITDHLESVRQKAQQALALGLIAGCALAAFGLVIGFKSGWADGLLIIGIGAVLVVVSLSLYLLNALLLKAESRARRVDEAVSEIHSMFKDLQEPLLSLASEAHISDATRSVIHRDKEREALRNAARADIVKGDWEMAYFIVDQMERRFGLREEAARLRAELEQARQDTIEVKIDEALEHINRLFTARDWARAESEIARLTRLLPDNEQVRSLGVRMQAARDAHKQELLASGMPPSSVTTWTAVSRSCGPWIPTSAGRRSPNSPTPLAMFSRPGSSTWESNSAWP